MVAIIISLGQISIKHGAHRISNEASELIWSVLSNTWIFFGLAMYMLAMAIWIVTIKNVPLHVATPISGLTFVIIPLFSSILLGEDFKLSSLIGSAVIILGIYISYMDMGQR